MMNHDISLAEELNYFHACFETDSRQASISLSREEGALTMTEHDVRRAFRSGNIRKAAGSDGVTGHVLKACADQLVPVR